MRISCIHMEQKKDKDVGEIVVNPPLPLDESAYKILCSRYIMPTEEGIVFSVEDSRHADSHLFHGVSWQCVYKREGAKRERRLSIVTGKTPYNGSDDYQSAFLFLEEIEKRRNSVIILTNNNAELIVKVKKEIADSRRSEIAYIVDELFATRMGNDFQNAHEKISTFSEREDGEQLMRDLVDIYSVVADKYHARRSIGVF